MSDTPDIAESSGGATSGRFVLGIVGAAIAVAAALAARLRRATR